MTIDQALQHAGGPDDIPDSVRQAIRDAMPKYLWIIDHYESREDTGWPTFDNRIRPLRRVHCEACGLDEVEELRGREWKLGSLPQGKRGVCPRCVGTVTAKHVSRGIRSLRDRLVAVWYQKSVVDPTVVVAQAAYIRRDFVDADPEEPWELDPTIQVEGIAVFDAAHRDALRIQLRPIYDGDACGHIGGRTWKQVRSLTTLQVGSVALFEWQRPERMVLTDSITEAIRGTPIERAWDDVYYNGESVYAMALITLRPCVEYMTRLGMQPIVAAAIDQTLPSRLIRWNGKSATAVLGISQRRMAEIKGRGIRLTPQLLAVLQHVDREGIRCGIQVAEGVAASMAIDARHAPTKIRMALSRFDPPRRHKALRYIARNKEYGLQYIVDMWEMVEGAGGSLSIDADAFPPDCRAAHDRLAARIRTAGDLRTDGKIRERVPKLAAAYGFAFGGLILRPAATAGEVIREGERLGHCVARYVKAYGDGDTNIFVLRRAVQPDEPWRTVEIDKTGRVLQDRGYKNDMGGIRVDDHYRAMLDLFWAAWAERRRGA